jgi:Tfp pilus assembly protein PilX
LRFDRGIGLIPALIFLVVFSIISVGISEKVLWERSTEHLYEEKIRSFYLAEECLIETERSIIEDVMIFNSCAKVVPSQSGADLYTIIAKGSYGNSVTKLRSVVAKDNGGSNFKVGNKRNLPMGRISFLWYYDT